MHVYQVASVMFNSLQPHGLQPTSLVLHGILQAGILEVICLVPGLISHHHSPSKKNKSIVIKFSNQMDPSYFPLAQFISYLWLGLSFSERFSLTSHKSNPHLTLLTSIYQRGNFIVVCMIIKWICVYHNRDKIYEGKNCLFVFWCIFSQVSPNS